MILVELVVEPAALAGLEVVVIRMACDVLVVHVVFAALDQRVEHVVLVEHVKEWAVESRWVKFLSVSDRLHAWNCFVLECQTWM